MGTVRLCVYCLLLFCLASCSHNSGRRDESDVVSGTILEFNGGPMTGPMYLYFDDGEVSYVNYDRNGIFGRTHVFKRRTVEKGTYETVSRNQGYAIIIDCKFGPDTLNVDTSNGIKSYSIPWDNTSGSLVPTEVRSVGPGQDVYGLAPSERRITM